MRSYSTKCVQCSQTLDLPAGHGEHEQSVRESGRPDLIAEVTGQGRLGVGLGGHQVHAAGAAVLEARAQHGPDRGDTVVLVRRRGHGQPGVVGEQRDHALDVGGDVGLGEAPGQGTFGGQGRPRLPPMAGVVAVLVQGRAGALQRALDRGRAGAEQAGYLVRAETDHVAEQERSELGLAA